MQAALTLSHNARRARILVGGLDLRDEQPQLVARLKSQRIQAARGELRNLLLADALRGHDATVWSFEHRVRDDLAELVSRCIEVGLLEAHTRLRDCSRCYDLDGPGDLGDLCDVTDGFCRL